MSGIIKKLSILLILLVIVVGVLVYIDITPQFKVDKKEISVDVYTDYLYNNYIANKMGQDLSDKVVVDGIVDTNTIGTYPIIYKLQYDNYHKEIKVNVNVVDQVSPIINLKGEKKYKVCKVDKYNEPGYTVFDNYDTNLDDKVETNLVVDKVVYTVKDSSGNIGRNVRYLIEEDDKGPEITLNGSASVNVIVGNTYEELSATAEDECDGDVTSSIEISGTVDTSKTGTYEITYTAKDTKGNTSTKTRKVVVSEKKTVVTPKRKTDNNPGIPGVIYLTFDDGPGSYTNSILDTLAKYNIKATFFVTGNGSDSIILREYQEGHTIALHTYTHNWDIYKSIDTYLDDLNKISNKVKNVTGYESKFVRFPGGSTNQKIYYRSKNTITMRDIADNIESKGYKFFDWNVCVEDAGNCAGKNVKDKESCVIGYFKRGLSKDRANIVLLHDVKSYTASGLESMIKYGLDNGYTFKPITDETEPYHFI